MKSTLRLLSLVAVASVMAAIAFAGTSSAAPATPKTGYLGIDPMAMVPDSDFPYKNDWAVGLTNTYNCFNAGVSLPQGAKITKVLIAYRNPVDDKRVYVELRRKLFSTGQTQNVGWRTFPRNDSVRTQNALHLAGAFTQIDNSKYTYGIGVCLGTPTNIFYGAHITYTYTD